MSKPTVNSKQLFGQFFGNSLAVMLLIDPETRRIVDANPTAEKFYGWNHAQLTAMCIDQINTLSTAEIKVEMEKARNQQRSYFKFRHRRAVGSVSPVEVFTNMVKIDGKEYFHSIVHDITGQVEADFKLHETNEYLENLFIYANAPIIVWDNSLVITRFNRAFELLSGYSANEVIGENIELLFPPEKKDKYLSFIKETTAGKRWETIEIEIQRNDGTIRTVIWNSANIHDNSKKNIIATIAQGQDITDRVAFQKQLEESEKKYRYLFVNNPLPMWIYDLDTLRFLEVNNAAIMHYGYSKEEFLSMTLKDIRPDEDLPMFLDDVKNTINKYNQAGVWRHVKKNGEIFKVEIASHKVDYEGRAARLVLISDVTQRQKAENRLKHSHDLMRYIIEHDRSAIAVHDRDLNYIYVSQRYLEQYNVQEKDIIGKYHYDVFPDLPQKWRDVHQKALKGEVSSADRDIYEKEDGTLVYTRWECRPWYEADGSIGGIVVYTEVINDRIEKELEIKKLNHRLEILVHSVQELSSVQSVEQVQNIVVTSARKLLGAVGATIIFKEKDQCFYAAEDAISPLWAGKRFPMEVVGPCKTKNRLLSTIFITTNGCPLKPIVPLL
jgi:PAS domain S-box-containing protein